MSEISIIDKLTGIEFEKFVKEFLENIGFSNLKTTKASGDFGVDVIGDLNNQKYVIQTKRYSRPVNLKSVQEVYTGMKYYSADFCMVVSNNIFTEAAIELAKKCNCKLIDRDDISQWLKKDFSSLQMFLDFLEEKKLKKFKIPSEKLIQEYFSLKKELDKQPTIFDVDAKCKFSSSVYRKRWGTWNLFLQAINEPIIQNKTITIKEFQDNYKSVKGKIGKTPTTKDMNDFGNFSSSVYERRFGSWNMFLKHIGDKENLKTDISKKDLIEEYLRIKNILNKNILSCNDIRKHSKYSLSTYLKRFGSWNIFLKEIG